MAGKNSHQGGGGGGGGWSRDVAWGPGDGGWGDEGEGVREGAGQTLVHETHAPKRISHIQFGLLNAEVCPLALVGASERPLRFFTG